MTAVLELEVGQEFERRFLYPDGHIETGKVRYTGRRIAIGVNAFEQRWLPELESLTLTIGPVIPL